MATGCESVSEGTESSTSSTCNHGHQFDFSSNSTTAASLRVLEATLPPERDDANPVPAMAMTMKEFDSKLDELRRENFNLKLRLYFLEKDRKGSHKSDAELMVQKELLKRDKALRAFEKMCDDKEREMAAMKVSCEHKVRNLKLELEGVKLEKENVDRALGVSQAVCRSLMSHLSDIRAFWQRQLVDKTASNVGLDLMHSMSNWFNTSEDLLNSASVLITDGDVSGLSTRRPSLAGGHLANQAHHQLDHQLNQSISGFFDNPMLTSQGAALTDDVGPGQTMSLANGLGNVDFMRQLSDFAARHSFTTTTLAEQFQPIHCQQELEIRSLQSLPVTAAATGGLGGPPPAAAGGSYLHFSSESEDNWSEPDIDVSRARIGLEIDTQASVAAPPPPRSVKPKSKRRASGMSSLGLLSDISELMGHHDGESHRSKRRMSDVVTGEMASQTDLNLLTLDVIFEDYQNLVGRSTEEAGCQTISSVTFDQGFQTDSVPVNSMSCQVDILRPSTVHKQVATDPMIRVTQGTQVIRPLAVDSGTQSDIVFAPSVTLPDSSTVEDTTGFRTIRPSSYRAAVGSMSPSSLFTYKAIGSNSSTPKANLTTLNQAKSLPVTPSKGDVGDDDLDCTLSSETFKVPSETQFARVKKATIAKLTPHYNGHFLDLNSNNNRTNGTSNFSSSAMSFNHDQNSNSNICPYASSGGLLIPTKTQTRAKQSLQVNINQLIAPSALDMRDSKQLSSPDLGLGDSDGDLVGLGLRAYLTLGHYQLLRGQITEASCIVSSLETLHKDFVLKLIGPDDLVADSRPFLSNLATILKNSKNICRAFTVEDQTALLGQLEKMRSKKENMEKAISRQLRKTDKLLKKATVNLQEAH